MICNRRKRGRVISVEGLASRELLTANLGGILGAEVAGYVGLLPHRIVGIVSGPLNYTVNPPIPGAGPSGVNSFNLFGRAEGVRISLNGSDHFSLTQINRSTYFNSYTNGSLTLTTAYGSTLAITYTGSGLSSTSGIGAITTRLRGVAVYTSGPHTGVVYAFNATVRGTLLPNQAGRLTMTFNLSR